MSVSNCNADSAQNYVWLTSWASFIRRGHQEPTNASHHHISMILLQLFSIYRDSIIIVYILAALVYTAHHQEIWEGSNNLIESSRSGQNLASLSRRLSLLTASYPPKIPIFTHLLLNYKVDKNKMNPFPTLISSSFLCNLPQDSGEWRKIIND